MDRISASLINPQQAYQWWLSAWQTIKPLLIAGNRLHVEVRQEKRSDAQSRLMWSALGDVARQVEWHGQKLDADAWRTWQPQRSNVSASFQESTADSSCSGSEPAR